MTKDQELAIVDRAAAELGRDSYLGPWLMSIRSELAGAIKSDLFPTPMLPAEAHRCAERIRIDAQTAAEATIEAANKKAADAVELARKRAEAIRHNAAGDLHQAIKRLMGEAW